MAVPYRLGKAVAFDSSHHHVYSIGGFDGTARGDIYSIIAPRDSCSLVSPSWTNLSCTEFPGCTPCGNMSTGDEAGDEACLSHLSHCQSLNVEVNSCQYPNCSKWQSCSECVSSQSSPDPFACGWCPCRSVCVRSPPLTDGDCDCDVISQCHPLVTSRCDWDDCETCQQRSGCVWAIFGSFAQCVAETSIGSGIITMPPGIITMPPGQCDKSCSVYTTCSSCAGQLVHSESRLWECRWSERLQLCMSPVSQPLVCAFGRCGRVAHLPPQCVQPCSIHTFCWRCIKQSTCGWCAAPDQSGKGLCLDGTIYGPTSDSCPSMTSISGNHSTNTSSEVMYSMWSFLGCPREDECANNHHTCRPDQECKDTKKSYECHCREGYKEYPE